MKVFVSFFLLALSTLAISSTVAIIDSGVDYEHEYFNMHVNANEVKDRRDNDGNGYQDDIFGWNFAEDNPDIIDHSFLGTFSQDVYKYFAVQGRMFLGEETEEDVEWLKKIRESEEFFKEMQIFGNFVHGTHVAGIAAGKQDDIKIMGLKIMPTQASLFFERGRSLGIMGGKQKKEDDGARSKILKSVLTELAKAQSRLMRDIGFYLSQQKVDVANGSFGSNYAQIKPIIEMGFKAIFWRKPKEGELHPFLMHFMLENLKGATELIKGSEKTLFVFAAGNNGTNNDEFPTSPANIRADNVITVAATYSYDFFAPFSNFGQLVDVAAPGMLIDSSIPGNHYLEVSGTSQASPFVAHIAARMKNINMNLTPNQMKRILMETVDKKEYLTGKVKSGGIVNIKRALWAASYSKKKDLDESIKESYRFVSEMQGTGRKLPESGQKNQDMAIAIRPQYTL